MITLQIMKNAHEVNEWHSIQYKSFGKVKTLDGGRLRSKHIVKNEVKK
jgi:hypothetical protein